MEPQERPKLGEIWARIPGGLASWALSWRQHGLIDEVLALWVTAENVTYGRAGRRYRLSMALFLDNFRRIVPSSEPHGSALPPHARRSTARTRARRRVCLTESSTPPPLNG